MTADADERLILLPFIDRSRLHDANPVFQRLAADGGTGLFVKPSGKPHAEFTRPHRPVFLMRIHAEGCIRCTIGVVPKFAGISDTDQRVTLRCTAASGGSILIGAGSGLGSLSSIWIKPFGRRDQFGRASRCPTLRECIGRIPALDPAIWARQHLDHRRASRLDLSDDRSCIVRITRGPYRHCAPAQRAPIDLSPVARFGRLGDHDKPTWRACDRNRRCADTSKLVCCGVRVSRSRQVSVGPNHRAPATERFPIGRVSALRTVRAGYRHKPG